MTENSPQNRFDAARTALMLLENHGVDPDPQCFEVAFCHEVQSHPALSKELNAAVKTNAVNADLIRDLHERHVQRGMTGEEITAVSHKLQNEISSVIAKLSETQEGTVAFSENLSDSDSQLQSAGSDPDQIQNILRGMLTETQKMSSITSDMDSQLAKTQKEVSDLKARLVEAEKEATTDPLTNLANRKGFDMSLREAIESSMHDTGDMCLILADVDRFKKFNDTHGHQLGDLVLRMVALSMQSLTKAPHVVARFGGEEFAIIMPNTDLDTAAAHADVIRQAIEKRKLVKKEDGQNLGRVTVSFGVSKFDPVKPINQLIEFADKALYAAKDRGRNCVVRDTEL